MGSMNHFLHQSNKLRFGKVFDGEEIIEYIDEDENNQQETENEKIEAIDATDKE